MKSALVWMIFGSILFAGPGAAAQMPKLKVETADSAYSIRLSGRTQSRVTVIQSNEGDTALDAEIKRARLKLSGTLFTRDFGYNFQVDFASGDVAIKDAYLDYFLVDVLGVRVGQFKKTFSRQHLTSSGSQEFVDRALTNKPFKAGRALGVTLLSNYKTSLLEWAFGAFNATKAGELPDHFEPMLVARLGWHSDNMKGYSEGDFEGGPLRWAVAGNAQINLGVGDATPNSQVGVDWAIKAHGFSGTGGVYVATDGDDFGSQAYSGFGAHMQGSYLFLGRYQPAVRYALSNQPGEDDVHELSAGFSVYLYKHSLKLQTDLTGRLTGASGNDLIVRTQAQVAF